MQIKIFKITALMIVLASAFFVVSVGDVQADSGESHSPYVQEKIVLTRAGDMLVSPVIQMERPFNTVAFQLPDQKEEVEGLFVNFNPPSPEWEMVEAHDDGFGVESLLLTEPTRTVQFKKAAEAGERSFIINADIFFQEEIAFTLSDYDLYAGPLVAQSGFTVIPRSQWGADETVRYWNPDVRQEPAKGNPDSGDPCEDLAGKFSYEIGITRTVRNSPSGEQLIWPLQYAKDIQKIVVHHTDSEIRDINGDSRINTRDYKEIVRAIYKYHTVTRGWGDIGYNYLIDPLGNIYEGRYGGDTVVGAHALCHNNGSLGIAIIGNYQDNNVPEPAMDALIQLIGREAKKFRIDPAGESVFRGKRLPNILGHRDVRATSCPGEKLYTALPRVRKRAALVYGGREFKQNLAEETLDYNAEALSSLENISLKPNERKRLILRFKNTGKQTWDQNTWLHVALNNNPNVQIIPLLADKRFVAANLREHSVSPGQAGSFEIELEAGYVGGDFEFEVAPVINGRYKVSRSAVFVNFSVERPRLDYEVISQNLPRDIIFQGQKIESFVELKNTGNVTWHNYGSNQITLGTESPRDHKSMFVKNNPARLGYLLDSEVPPGQIGRFTLNLEVPLNLEKRIVERFTPVIEGIAWLPDKNMGFSAAIKKPIHLARTQKVNPVITLLPGEMKKFEVEMENRGDLAWNEDNMTVTLLGRGLKVFKARMAPENEVKPKKKAAFSFWVQAPYQEGRHSVYLRARFNSVSIRGGAARYVVNVEKPKLRAQMVDQGDRDMTLQPGEVKTITVQFKNLGNTVWRRDGSNAVHLGTAHPQDRGSEMFYEPGWDSKFRAAALKEDEVRPGETGTFTFSVRSLKKGVRKEYFQLVAENVGWIDGSLVRWDFRVFGDKVQAQKPAPKTTTKTSASAAPKITPLPVYYTPPTVEDRLMRVRLSYASENSTITSSQAFTVTDSDGQILYRANGGDVLDVRHVQNSLHAQLGEAVRSSSTLRFTPASTGIMKIASWNHAPGWNPSLNDNEFRGTMEIRILDDEVIYINELPLEDYLKGLGEVSNSAPLEKQKAIAVLARSYARFYMQEENRKFPGMPYDGSDDPAIFQKYLGYGMEKRSPEFVGAVALTENEVVTYRGQLVKTPYFNQSDGRTRSAQEVWGWTNTLYLISVSDHWCTGLTLNGHGVGLSGCGAEAQAKEGKTYDDIIKYYYKDVEVKELEFK